MPLNTELAELIRDSKNYDKARYVIAAKLGGREHVVGETTLGPLEAMQIMLQAQKYMATAVNAVDREILYKGRSLRISVASE